MCRVHDLLPVDNPVGDSDRMTEADLMRAIQIHASKLGLRLFRNNNGTGWAGVTSRVNATDMLIRNARPLHAGLGTGTSDLIGWTPLLVKPEHVGLTLAVFTAAEIKSSKGRLTDQQRNFIETVNTSGGIAVCARSVSDLEGAVKHVRERIIEPP